MKMYSINADYRPWNKGHNWYYVLANSKKEAKEKFKERISWLDIYEITETDADKAKTILANPMKFIVF